MTGLARHSFCLAIFCLAIFAVMAGGCDHPTGGSPKEQVEVLSGPWEYRWGDSPRDGEGRLAWAQPGDATRQDGRGWQRSLDSTRPGGRSGNRFLWLRTRLPGPQVRTPTLYFLIVEQIFEAYLDGQLIYRFGTLDGDGKDARRFLGNRTHMIPLPADYVGKELTLRIYSADDTVIGVSGSARIGSAQAIITAMVRDDASDAVVGVVLCAMGLSAVLLFLIQRTDEAYLHYGCFALSMGIWILCQMGCRNYLVDAPMAWLTVEIFALYAAVAFLVRYIVQIFGKGPFGLARILSYFLFAYVILAAILVGLGVIPLLYPLQPFRILLLCAIAYTLIMMAILSLQGNAEARLFAAGFLVSALFAVHDTLALMGFLPRSEISFSQFGQGGFVVCIGLILLRRFRRVHLTLAQAEKTLSEKVALLEDRNREVQQLNDDLRRQIEARSKDLAASILDASSSFSEFEVQILAEGFLLADRYRVIRLIGQGGMGSVYEVERVTDGRHLAAKVLSVKAGKQVLARFAREAQLLAKLKHPNLVTIQDVDMTQSHMAYIVMELVIGQSLAALSSKFRNLAFAKKVLAQVADALDMVHGQGIVHRDLKPENVLIQNPEDPGRLTAKLVDFGVSMILDSGAPSGRSTEPAADETQPALAPVADAEKGIHPSALDVTISDGTKAPASSPSSTTNAKPQSSESGSQRKDRRSHDRISERPASLTQTGVIMGTPLYMAPELRQGAKHARPSSDMFSFGVMAYEVITGQLPSDQPALFQVFRKDRSWFARVHTKNPDVPAALAELIERCLDPEPEHRPTAVEVKAALAAL